MHFIRPRTPGPSPQHATDTIPDEMGNPNHPRHHVPIKPFLQDTDSTHTGQSTHQQVSQGLRAQLHHLLPRHTWFHVRIQIHQLSNVPLLDGDFAAKWRFKNVHAAPGTKKGILGMVRGRSQARSLERGRERQRSTLDTTAKDDDSRFRASFDASSDYSTLSGAGTPARLSTNSRRPSHPSSIAPTSSSSSTESRIPFDPSIFSPSQLSSTTSSTSPASSRSTAAKQVTAPLLQPAAHTPAAHAPARGSTPFVPLKDHDVIWEHTLDTVVRMDVERDTHDLLPNELKLTISQRVEMDDNKSITSKFGALYLNLAEYASAGIVSRRYLLVESKTNATLKLTIQLENVGGEIQWIAPPLPKGEILNGVVALLENEVYRTKPRKLDLHGPYFTSPQLDSDPYDRATRTPTSIYSVSTIGEDGQISRSPGGAPLHHPHPHHHHSSRRSHSSNARGREHIAFDVAKLPMAYGPENTEALIEALFNPTLVVDKSKESPFTIVITPDELATSHSDVSGSSTSSNAGAGRRPSLTPSLDDASSATLAEGRHQHRGRHQHQQRQQQQQQHHHQHSGSLGSLNYSWTFVQGGGGGGLAPSGNGNGNTNHKAEVASVYSTTSSDDTCASSSSPKSGKSLVHQLLNHQHHQHPNSNSNSTSTSPRKNSGNGRGSIDSTMSNLPPLPLPLVTGIIPEEEFGSGALPAPLPLLPPPVHPLHASRDLYQHRHSGSGSSQGHGYAHGRGSTVTLPIGMVMGAGAGEQQQQHQQAGGIKTWWKKVSTVSRPVTPALVR